MNIYCGIRFSRGVPIAPRNAMGHALFSVLYVVTVPITRCTSGSNGSPVRLRRPHLREAPADFGLVCLATTFMHNPG